MYAAAVPGTHKNNFKFSVCSKRTVKEIIDMRSNWCFKPMQSNICGNFWVTFFNLISYKQLLKYKIHMQYFPLILTIVCKCLV